MTAILLLSGGLAAALYSAHLIAKAKELAAAWRRRIVIAAWLTPVVVVVAAVSFDVTVPWPVLLLGAVVVAAMLWHKRGRPSSVITRWGQQNLRKKGVASLLDIIRFGSAWAMRRTLAVIRPSMAALTRWQRARVKTTEVAVPLARVGPLRVHASLRDVVTIFGGPGVGKTGWMAGRVIDHPGAAVTTSTRTDLMDITRPLRERGRGPVYVYNPGGLGGIESTVGFDPVTGCADPVVATARAADMIPESEGAGDHSYWEGQARRVLAALLHAAALGDRSMRDVLRWVADPKASAREVTSLLRRSPEPAFEADIQQYHSCNDKTQTSITSSVMPALAWLTSSTAVASTNGNPFDVTALLRDRGTVYMLGRHEAHTAPLLAALTGYIAREARRLAAYQPGGRLDPPLGLFLDEAARVVPVPLPDWTGDFGGSGIHICVAVQSRADLINRWGPTGAATILNNSGAAMLFGGTKDINDLEQWSRLAGDRDEPVVTRGKNGAVVSRSVRKTPVLSPAQLANLTAGRVVVFRRGMPPAIGRVQMAWKRADVRAHARITRRVTTPARPVVLAQSPTREVPSVAQ